MTKRFAFGIGVLVTLASVAIVQSAVRPASAYQQAQELCTMPQDLRYSPGALERRDGEVYRCLFVFGENLKPAGVAWIKMVKQGDAFVPKEPSAGR